MVRSCINVRARQTKLDGELTYLEDLIIDPELRGQGYGRRMIQQVAELAKQQDCLRVEWATKFDNPARKLYDELAECSFVEYRLKV